ncbi:hypothetical protein [Pseudochrobactrum sp. XF203]|uniref:hypothetical protein n=1 Tax=Pseudochrobactrum sp. XF203 TaxID=2879116 RepID=UPI001CE2416E|nr:hypothetical protein [Pseudochrobactrum sp. XF203]UCA46887.1 hypothetical protein LDL70_06665 [Pseudochrobactrum sp. XF203]
MALLKSIFATLLISTILSGCQTKPIEAMSYAEKIELGKKLQAICEKHGLKPLTEAYNNCFRTELSREAYQRKQNAVRGQQAAQAFSEGMQNMSNNYYRAAASRPTQQSITCSQVPGPTPTVRCN